MSWGERSCSKELAPKNDFGGCSVATMRGCNVTCPYYSWDGKTKPDSQEMMSRAQKRLVQRHMETGK